MRKRLKHLRESRNLSVKDVASAVGISDSHYYKIESGIRNPKFILAGELARFFNTNVDKLFFEEDLDKTSKKRVAI